jgi:pimeloyl-ACP methyl ester carboxylesterase
MDTSGSVGLNYKKLGSGPHLIILHGLFGSLDNWMTLGKQWSEAYTVWLIDQRNHGKSPHTEAFSYPLMAADLHAFFEAEGIEQAIVLGHSMGGKTAMEFSVHFSDKVKQLIVVDIAPVAYEVHHYPIIRALESVELETIDSRQQAEEELSKQISEAGVRQFLLKNLERKKVGGYRWKFNLPVLSREIVPISAYDVPQGKYEGETLFVKGAKSDYIVDENRETIREKFPAARVVTIKGAGHWVHAEQAEAFYTAVSTFMKD